MAPPETRFLERADVEALFQRLPTRGRHVARSRLLLLFLYNTGARVQEVADLRVGDLDLVALRVRLHGKGDKWRTCPLWPQTVGELQRRLAARNISTTSDAPVFVSHHRRPLTRFGIYKVVRRLTSTPGTPTTAAAHRPASPHVFRHTAAVHLIEAGVDVNVIRGWLGHVSLDTTNRYAEINTRMKERRPSSSVGHPWAAIKPASHAPFGTMTPACCPGWRRFETLCGHRRALRLDFLRHVRWKRHIMRLGTKPRLCVWSHNRGE